MSPHITPSLRKHLHRAHEVIVGGGVPMTPDEIVEWVASAEHVVTLSRDGRVVAHAEAHRSRFAPHRASVSAAVEHEFWGQGLGAYVLGRVLAWCDEPAVGIEYVDGWAWHDNERALRMDARLGFVEVGRIVDVFRDGSRSRDQVILVRRRAV
jgi:RimJ/RimL family protein N-acetyltransferase